MCWLQCWGSGRILVPFARIRQNIMNILTNKQYGTIFYKEKPLTIIGLFTPQKIPLSKLVKKDLKYIFSFLLILHTSILT